MRIFGFFTLVCAVGLAQVGHAQNVTYSGELSYRLGDNSQDSSAFESQVAFSHPDQFGVQAGLSFERFAGGLVAWGLDLHLHGFVADRAKVGGYVEYQTGNQGLLDVTYWGGEAMFELGVADIEARLGGASGNGSTATTAALTGYFPVNPKLELSLGYSGIYDSGADAHRVYGRVSYASLIPDNGIKLFGEVSYVDLAGAVDDTSITFGAEWAFGGGNTGVGRNFSRPKTIIDF